MKWVGNELSADNYRMVYVPENFAHGFVTMEDHSEVYYPVSQFYTPGAERGLRWNDPAFKIKWPVEISVVSDKDQSHMDFSIESLK
jgi:dTDP-4-dehydrorhamnose 3,5-epimerase